MHCARSPRIVFMASLRLLKLARVMPRTPLVSMARCFSVPTFVDRAEVTERVINRVKDFEKVPADKVNAKAHFVNDLGLDSLDAVEVVMAVEEEFSIEIPDDVADDLLSIAQCVDFIAQHPQAK